MAQSVKCSVSRCIALIRHRCLPGSSLGKFSTVLLSVVFKALVGHSCLPAMPSVYNQRTHGIVLLYRECFRGAMTVMKMFTRNGAPTQLQVWKVHEIQGSCTAGFGVRVGPLAFLM